MADENQQTALLEGENSAAIVIAPDSPFGKFLAANKDAGKETVGEARDTFKKDVHDARRTELVKLFHQGFDIIQREQKLLNTLREDIDAEYDLEGKVVVPKRLSAKRNKERNDQKQKIQAWVNAFNKAAGDEADTSKLVELIGKYKDGGPAK
jgi:hypothetical protein